MNEQPSSSPLLLACGRFLVRLWIVTYDSKGPVRDNFVYFLMNKDQQCLLDAIWSFSFGFAVIDSGGPLPGELTHPLLTHGKEGQSHVLPAPRFRELGHTNGKKQNNDRI